MVSFMLTERYMNRVGVVLHATGHVFESDKFEWKGLLNLHLYLMVDLERKKINK